MNKLDDNVNHEIILTGKYAKLSCSTPGCRLQVWYKPQESEGATEDASYKYFRCILTQHSIEAHVKALGKVYTPTPARVSIKETAKKRKSSTKKDDGPSKKKSKKVKSEQKKRKE